jgi:hypothetical protein
MTDLALGEATANNTPDKNPAVQNMKYLHFYFFFLWVIFARFGFRSFDFGSKTHAFDLVSVCSTRTDLSRTGDLGVHEPHLQLGDHVVPQLRQSTRICQEPNIFTFF